MAGHARNERAEDVAIYAALTAFCLAVLYPFFYTVINSLNADLPFARHSSGRPAGR